MEFHLVVRHPFGSYGRGDRVTDAQDVARLKREGSDHVIRVAAPATDATRQEPPATA